jgi:glycine cleavage system T protein
MPEVGEAVPQILKQTPLRQNQEALGATFSTLFDWEMAQSFGDAAKEHQAVRNSVGLLDLSFCGAIRVGGSEGPAFLQGLVTNDVKTLGAGQGMRAAFLSGKGKVIALCRIFALEGGQYLIITDPQTHEKVFKYVFPMSYAGDFKVEDVTDSHRLLSVQGPKALLVMKEACFEPVPPLSAHQWISAIMAGHHVMVATASHTGEAGYDVLAPTAALADIWDFLLLKGSFHSISPVGFEAADALRIEAGIPRYGQDVDEGNMMLETGLADAVSFTKGCYTGQEAVAMATYRGHVSKRLSGLQFDPTETMPSHGAKVVKDGKEIGVVTSSLKSPTLKSVIALAMLKYGFFEAGTTVEVESEADLLLSAVVTKLPFIQNS